MNIGTFIKKIDFDSFAEIQKVEALSYYMLRVENKIEFDIQLVSDKLFKNGFGKPNSSRLRQNLTKSKSFIQGIDKGSYKLHATKIRELDVTYNFLTIISDNIETDNSILPQDLYSNTRGYITKLALQINASYENNISDGCAVLMRRLMEILLILGYRAKSREDEIIDSLSSQYKNLASIIDYTISNKVLGLQKDTVEVLHDF